VRLPGRRSYSLQLFLINTAPDADGKDEDAGLFGAVGLRQSIECFDVRLTVRDQDKQARNGRVRSGNTIKKHLSSSDSQGSGDVRLSAIDIQIFYRLHQV